ncbi:helix-turn-helix domain-containing protein [Actinokineospora bangkokensis]|uniref:Helix-turn-helix domain-containing protein n=1 Tax=Actinokineospora bangkokensis TaxID=1193682 RepID=A0A1Q9LSR3_9PSEU|nr:helix-turn-helix domain-containing protein [Actinokineospora bangkokensis]OLR95082.1 hypothetical protein BJP25_09065 [Actinokineospora bangkokensis]
MTNHEPGPTPNDLTSASNRLPELISVAAAQLLGVSRATAYRAAAAGDLPTRRFGKRLYVVRRKLDAWLDGNEHIDEVAA